MFRRIAGILTIIAFVFVLLVFPQQPGQDSERNGTVLEKLDTIQRQYAVMAYTLNSVKATVDAVQPLIITNTEHLRLLDQRVDRVQTELQRHEDGSTKVPVDVATVSTRIDSIVEDIEWIKKAGAWVAGGVGSLILGSLWVLITRVSNRGVPPAWAQPEVIEQTRHRSQVVANLAEVKEAAHKAYETANEVNAKLATIGVKMRDGEPLNPNEKEKVNE